VLGANDGIVSTAGIVVGVAAASAARGPVFTAGIAGLVAGALSMAVGEYVSVSTQRDTERALLHKERQELQRQPVRASYMHRRVRSSHKPSPSRSRASFAQFSAGRLNPLPRNVFHTRIEDMIGAGWRYRRTR
jgi:vacuolar iron transporter family protein